MVNEDITDDIGKEFDRVEVQEGVTLAQGELPPITVPTGAAPPAPKPKDPLPFLASLKGHTRPIERLNSFQVPSPPSVSNLPSSSSVHPTTIGLISADSLGALKIWHLSRDGDRIRSSLMEERRDHEIGVYDLVVSKPLLGDVGEEEESGEIWTGAYSPRPSKCQNPDILEEKH